MAEAYGGHDELWRDCAVWLTRWGVLRSDHRVNWPRATIVDLAHTLRDGVLLCTLLSKIDPRCIDMKDVNLKPTMAQFLCLRNIDLFLKICVGSFGLKDSDLFDGLMLFDLTNFHKVLCTLSKLSLTPKAQRGNIPGFSAQDVSSSAEEDVYHSLKMLEMPVRNSRNYTYQYGDVKGEEIYQDLCSLQAVNSILAELAQSHTLEKRDFVIKELIDTERNYTEVLGKLKKNFMKPLKEFLDEETHSIIFFKISELHEIHIGFLNQLTTLNVDYNNTRLSDIFLKWCKKFLVYASYCANLSKACNVLQERCDKDDAFNQTILKYEKDDNNGKFKLRDILSVPMQRILKYHLLLEKLIENTEPSHDEYKDLKRAREAMLDVAGYINEAARDSEHIAVLKKLQDNIVEWDSSEINLVSFGRLIRDGEIKIKAHADQRTKNRYVFIFEKAMFICKQMKYNQFAYRDVLNIADFHVEEVNNRATLNREARWSYSWYLVKNDKSIAYTLSVRSAEIKLKMANALKEAINNLKPMLRTNHKFEMHSFEEPHNCNHCSKYLKGLVYQGYKCSVCGISVHKECIVASGKCGATPTPAPLPVRAVSQPSDKLWFAGVMDRNEASFLLEERCNGTYLVRIRPQSEEKDRFALSLKTDNVVKHMKICNQTLGNEQKFYLSLSKYFSSIEELIENYQSNSLKENFARLEENTRLEWPYRQVLAHVTEDFDPQERIQVRLRQGDRVVIVGKEGYREGWWKVRSKTGIGYFPKDLLHEEQDIFHEYDL